MHISIFILLFCFIGTSFAEPVLGKSMAELQASFSIKSNGTFLAQASPKVLGKILESKPHISVVDFASQQPFQDDFVWKVLDEHSQGAIWSDISLLKKSGSLRGEVSKLIRQEASQAWVRFADGKISALAEIVPAQKGLSGGLYTMRLVELDISTSNWEISKIRWNSKWDLSDWKGNKSSCPKNCTLSHVATPKLSLEMKPSVIKLALYLENKDPIDVPGDFTQWTGEAQKDFVMSTIGFLDSERNWMLKQLWPLIEVQQNGALWDWYALSRQKIKLTPEEVRTWARNGGGVKLWTLLDVKVGGKRVKWTSDLHGYSAIEVFN